MVTLDKQLLDEARGCINAENTEVLNELILAYEEAVALHNCASPGHEVYRDRSERKLRQSVFDRRLIQLNERSAAAQQQAAMLMQRSEKLHQQGDRLNERVEKVLKRFAH